MHLLACGLRRGEQRRGGRRRRQRDVETEELLEHTDIDSSQADSKTLDFSLMR